MASFKKLERSPISISLNFKMIWSPNLEAQFCRKFLSRISYSDCKVKVKIIAATKAIAYTPNVVAANIVVQML